VHVSVSRNADGRLFGQIFGLFFTNSTINSAATVGAIGNVAIGGNISALNVGMTGWVDGFRVSDEVLYPSGKWGLVPDDPGLTYTINPLDIKIVEPDINPTTKLMPVQGIDLLSPVQVIDLQPETEPQIGGCGGIQIWG
jgi:hypothetical protein